MSQIANAKDYSLQELLVAAAAREIKDGEKVFAGVGIPCLGAMVAQLTHARTAIIAVEAGCIGPSARRIILGIGDNPCMERALCTTSLWRLFSDQQNGFFDVGMVGGAQVDIYGNLNSTAIFGEGSYYQPASRLPGSGGANDIASSAGRTVIMVPLQRRRFLQRVDYITSPGYITGPGSREAVGLPGGGPSAVITNKCVFRFDPETREMYLASVHPGVTVDDVRKEVSWDLKVAKDLETTKPPTVEMLEITRTIDLEKIYLGGGLKSLSFERYVKMLETSFERLASLF
ncbi:MAG: glutaconate CoA-transferase [Firmicutes bacterium]|nr:glutaconate CoA-transferase [Bacillota bacterium]